MYNVIFLIESANNFKIGQILYPTQVCPDIEGIEEF